MKIGFFENKHPLLTRSTDGHYFDLEEWLVYTDSLGNRWRTNTQTDGMSTPRLIWFILPPFGKCWYSSILHDGAFRNSIQRWNSVELCWQVANVNEWLANWLIHDAMVAQGASKWEHKAVDIALKYFGWRALQEDRKK